MAKKKRKTKSVDWATPDILKERVEVLKEVFPEIISDGKIDYDKLKEALSGELSEGPERYSFSWAGKRDAIRLLQIPSGATLIPAPKESVGFDNAKNVFIEGENLEVLKLLYKSYAGKIKLIYIDPPYNTGSDLIYPDSFSDPLDAYLKLTGQRDSEGNVLTSNPETSGRYHSAWLSMMYPRLFVARQLLREDGAIFVSVDDHEANNLRNIMNEIFGEENFLAQVVWQKVYSPRMDAKGYSGDHDYILVYGRSEESGAGSLAFKQNIKQFNHTDKKTGKKYRRRSLRKEGKGSRREDRPNLFYSIAEPVAQTPSSDRPFASGRLPVCYRQSTFETLS